ncbi:4454_t:CDS:2 [Entrophospora sp. SA101]|nr:4454_t:CDS:2 [Entrophospora sp. SA101]
MKILSCKINETPVTVILDSGANCNIIGKSLVDELGMFHEINPSFQSKDNESKKVKVTGVSVTNKPELESVLILGQPWFQENAMKQDFPNKTLTLLDGTSFEVKCN